MPRALRSLPDTHKGEIIHSFKTAAAWERWLKSHAEQAEGIWIRFPKKGTGIASVTRTETLDIALCWGWIDGQAASQDETYYLQRWTRRRKTSKWSKINRDKTEKLIRDGLMQEPGLREIEAAKKDGRWDAAYDSPRTITVPPDFQQALSANTKAEAFFKTLTGSNRYAFLYRLHEAKRPETKIRRIGNFIAMLEQGKTFH